MSKLLNLAQGLIRANQNSMPNTPWEDAAINAIMSGDAQAGQQIANNIMQSMGITKEQVMEQAKKQFNFPF